MADEHALTVEGDAQQGRTSMLGLNGDPEKWGQWCAKYLLAATLLSRLAQGERDKEWRSEP